MPAASNDAPFSPNPLNYYSQPDYDLNPLDTISEIVMKKKLLTATSLLMLGMLAIPQPHTATAQDLSVDGRHDPHQPIYLPWR